MLLPHCCLNDNAIKEWELRIIVARAVREQVLNVPTICGWGTPEGFGAHRKFALDDSANANRLRKWWKQTLILGNIDLKLSPRSGIPCFAPLISRQHSYLKMISALLISFYGPSVLHQQYQSGFMHLLTKLSDYLWYQQGCLKFRVKVPLMFL